MVKILCTQTLWTPCNLHVVHESFEKRVKDSEWNFGNTCILCGKFFLDTPARREDFIQITGSDLFPFRFCQHRWVEDIKVAEQVLKIWLHVNKYVKTVKSGRAPASTFLFLSYLHATIPIS